MYLLGKKADKLNEDDIKRLVQNKVQENKSLDYKKELKLDQDRDKKEFLFDITSMSNTDGGCLIFGIEECKDEKGQNTGTPERIVGITIANYDKLSQQIEDIIKGNTEPCISNIALNPLTIDGQKVLVIGVSKTLGLPIMVTFNSTNKFYRRRNSGKYSVDVYELNQMFMQNQVLKESAEKFRMQRIEKVRSGRVFPNLAIDTSFFIHIIPFNFQSEQTLDLTNAKHMDINEIMKPMFVFSYSDMFNVDGYATWCGMGNPHIDAYDQLFRNGIYEVYSANLFEQRTITTEQKILCMYGTSFIPDVLDKIANAFNVLKKFQIEPPFIIGISMFGMKGGVIHVTPNYSPAIRIIGRPFLVDEIYLPPIVIPTYEADIYSYLKPIFDIVWQAVSQNQSPSYNPKE
jgi:hypothetical protein